MKRLLSLGSCLAVVTSVLTAQPHDESRYRIRPLPTPYGFAFVGTGVTGGAGGPEVTVTTAEELLFYATRNEPYVINVIDTIEIVRGIGNFPQTAGEYHIGSNTTLRGVGANATILYGGFKIQNVSNVIIQNLHFDGTYQGFNPSLENVPCASLPEGTHRYNYGPCLKIGEKGPTDKALDITHGSERIWITQNSFRRYSDEAMSIKREASYVTLSWNSFDDPVSGKYGMILLIGHSDTHTLDIGRLKTTLHHNYFAGRDRQPRVRFGQVHIFNNYYHNPAGNFSYGAAAQRDSEVLVEGNYYHDIRNNRPWRFDLNALQGYVAERGNHFDNTTAPATRGSVGVEIFDPADAYAYALDPAEDIRTIVTTGVGAGNWDPTVGERPVPAIPRTILPARSATVNRLPVFAWSEALFSETHQLQVSRTSGFAAADIVLDTLLGTAAFHPVWALDPTTTYHWRVRSVNGRGPGGWSSASTFTTDTSTSVGTEEERPITVLLHPNTPNPFNPGTDIRFTLPADASVSLSVHDVLGRTVATLADNRFLSSGTHSFRFDTAPLNLASGVYLYRLEARLSDGSATITQTRRMLLTK